MEKAYVVDTNSWYRDLEEIKVLAQTEKIVVLGTVLREIDKHKTSDNPELAFMSRTTSRYLKENFDNFIFDHKDYNAEWVLGQEYSNEYADNRIVAAAKHYGGVVSGDLNVQFKAKAFDIDVISFDEQYVEEEPYTGFVEVKMSQEGFDDFYNNRLHLNEFELIINQYLIVYDKYTNEAIESFKWDGAIYSPIKRKTFKSMFVDEFEAWDEYQACAIDAVMNHSLVMLRGKAGTAKTQISISYALQQLQAEKINKIVIFSNAMPTANSFYHGLVKGDLKQKLFSSSIGNILMSKLGSFEAIEAMMMTEQLLILPASDIRGFDSNGMKAKIVLTEAQNWNDELLKLAIQRLGEDSSMIIEGDNATQIDSAVSRGNRNGMRKASQVFKGWHDYAEIELQNIYRSEIAARAELMTEF